VIAAVLVLGVIAALALSGGGGDEGGKDEPDTTEARTDTGSADPEEGKVRTAVETALGAVVGGDSDVFCGSLSIRYQNQQFGGINECTKAFDRGDLPRQFTPEEINVESVDVSDGKATATLVGGEVFRLTEGSNGFWQIDALG
jgi:hypothetical protein